MLGKIEAHAEAERFVQETGVEPLSAWRILSILARNPEEKIRQILADSLRRVSDLSTISGASPHADSSAPIIVAAETVASGGAGGGSSVTSASSYGETAADSSLTSTATPARDSMRLHFECTLSKESFLNEGEAIQGLKLLFSKSENMDRVKGILEDRALEQYVLCIKEDQPLSLYIFGDLDYCESVLSEYSSYFKVNTLERDTHASRVA